MVSEITYFMVFITVASTVVACALGFSRLIQTRKPSKRKLMPYECGNIVSGDPRIQFKIRYYIFGLLLIVLDVEMLFIFPWAVVFRRIGMMAFLEMLVFLGIVLIGIVYAWRKGDLEWI